MADRLPVSIACGRFSCDGYVLTHVIWRNSYGSYQPETGVHFINPDGSTRDFRLIEHGCDKWPIVNEIIRRGLAKGWDAYRIGQVVPRLARLQARAA